MVLKSIAIIILVASSGIGSLFHPSRGSGSLLTQYSSRVAKVCTQFSTDGNLILLDTLNTTEYYVTGAGNGGKLYVVLSSAKGRYDYFDYMIIADSRMSVLAIDILKYRSDYGYEISSKKWLSQFYNREGREFRYKENIDVLSGASWSAPSLVKDINIIIEELRNFQKKI
jgi:hypothetical protein